MPSPFNQFLRSGAEASRKLLRNWKLKSDDRTRTVGIVDAMQRLFSQLPSRSCDASDEAPQVRSECFVVC